MSLHVPFLLTDLSRHYDELLCELAYFFKEAPTPWVEIFAQGSRCSVQKSSQIFAKDTSLIPITLETLYASSLLGGSHAILALPDQIGLLCYNQIIHRTPNPMDLLRPTVRLVHIDGYVIIIELTHSSHNPYPSKTPGVFNYGTHESQVIGFLDECYLEIVNKFHIPPLNAWVAKYTY